VNGADDAEPATRYGPAAQRIDTTVAHPARRYNYWLGGKDHFAADRESGDAVLAVFPTARAAALANRAFLVRAVTFLVREAGVRQFLDIGNGIPAPGNTHEVAQAIAPSTRVVYVDNDPIVLAHSRALLTSAPGGHTASSVGSAEKSASPSSRVGSAEKSASPRHVEADLRGYQALLTHPDLIATLDLDQPVGLILGAVLHFLPDADDPYAIVRGLVSALAAGSYLVVSHGTADYSPPELQAQLREAIRHGAMYPRSREEFTRFFDGLDLVEPGVVSVPDWRRGDETYLTPFEASAWCAVGRIALS
jgi:hypothetical protein